MDVTAIRLPKLNTCCFCVPLRFGHLTWGYINLVYHSVIFGIYLIIAFIFAALILGMGGGEVMPSMELALVLPTLMFFIFIYNIMFIISGHSNNYEMLKGLFVCGIILWIVEVLYSPCLASRLKYLEFNTRRLVLFTIVVILEPILQSYSVLLVYSAMKDQQAENHSVAFINFVRNNQETDRMPLILTNNDNRNADPKNGDHRNAKSGNYY